MPSDIPFNRELSFEYGKIERVAPMIRRIVAPNPSAFTFHGTGTYIVGEGRVAVIDPGPMIQSHIDALLEGLEGEEITHILITHTHRDHSPAAAPVKAATGAPTYGYGPHGSGKIEAGVEVEEGGDRDFVPDEAVRDGDIIEGEGWSMEAVHTPGHTSNHLCFQLREERALFPGDHVMGWSTTIISPPDGDMKDYMTSLRRLLDRDDRVYWPTHGAPIEDPKTYVEALIKHREAREEQIRRCLADGLHTLEEMVPRMYAKDVPPQMFPAAKRSVFAHVIYLVQKGEVESQGPLSVDGRYQLAG